MTARCDLYRRYFDAIAEHPGLKPWRYTGMMNTSYSNVISVISRMEYYGYLLYEDDEGRLYADKIIVRSPGDLGEKYAPERDRSYDEDWNGGKERIEKIRKAMTDYQRRVVSGEVDYRRGGFTKDIYGFARRHDAQ